VIKLILEKLISWWTVVLFSLIIFVLVITAIVFFISDGTDYSFTASGRQHLEFNVFYIDNNIFDENPIPRNRDFLMSHTDRIEVTGNFAAQFSEIVSIYYSYVAEKRLVIRYIGTTAPNRSVHEVTTILAQESGNIQADYLHIRPGAVYTVNPREHIQIYLHFVENHAGRLNEEGLIVHGLRGFTADLIVEFTHTIHIPEAGLSETITNGYRIPLTTEVYSIYTIGLPTFELSDASTRTLTLPMAVIFSATFIISIFGLLRNIKKKTADNNEFLQTANDIIKKYNQEIVVYDRPIDLSEHKVMAVREFDELIKLAVNLNKHIMCYRDDTHTEFAIIVDEYACLYTIKYGETHPELHDCIVNSEDFKTENVLHNEKTGE